MNTYYIAGLPVTDELYHYGILGQKWGIRRYQNPDGTLTSAGKARYGNSTEAKKNKKEMAAAYNRVARNNAAPYEYTEGRLGKKLGDDYKLLRYNLDAAKKESGYTDALQREREAVNNLNTKKIPFAINRNKALLDDLHNAQGEVFTKSLLANDYFVNMTMDMVNDMPKDIRDEAMAYAYMWAGYDR